MDPTQPVYDTTSPYAANFGGYFAWTKDGSSLNDPTYSKTKNALAPNNPVADLMLKTTTTPDGTSSGTPTLITRCTALKTCASMQPQALTSHRASKIRMWLQPPP